MKNEYTVCHQWTRRVVGEIYKQTEYSFLIQLFYVLINDSTLQYHLPRSLQIKHEFLKLKFTLRNLSVYFLCFIHYIFAVFEAYTISYFKQYIHILH